MKQRATLFILLFALLCAMPLKIIASAIHEMGKVTIYVNQEETFYRSYIPSAYYVSEDGWFLRQKNGNAWIDGQAFYDVKIVSKNSESCTILGLMENYDPYALYPSSTELHCKGTRQSIGEYEEMVWIIEVLPDPNPKPTGIDVSPSSKTIKVDETFTPTYTLTPSNAITTVTWSSDDSSIASVNSSTGLVTGKKAGSTYINATTSNGKTDWCKVTVTPSESEIAIDEINFPDENFRNWILAQDYGKDGKLTESEIISVTEIKVGQRNIKNLKGIEYFTGLRRLNCTTNQLTALDVSKNTALTYLWCVNNQLTVLDVSKNTELWSVDCSNNQLTVLDVSKNTELNNLYCDNNQLSALDVSKNTALYVLSCRDNQLTALDVSKNTTLDIFYCSTNQLTALDVSKNTALRYFHCDNNQIKGVGMDKLINSLPHNTTGETHDFRVFDSSGSSEGNVCTKKQVAVAKAKGWTPKFFDGTVWLEYEGSEESPFVKGDVNGDGEVTGTDLVALANIILGKQPETSGADVNGDGKVTGTDIVSLSDIILGKDK